MVYNNPYFVQGEVGKNQVQSEGKFLGRKFFFQTDSRDICEFEVYFCVNSDYQANILTVMLAL